MSGNDAGAALTGQIPDASHDLAVVQGIENLVDFGRVLEARGDVGKVIDEILRYLSAVRVLSERERVCLRGNRDEGEVAGYDSVDDSEGASWHA